jgi:signal transduction histidine kinase
VANGGDPIDFENLAKIFAPHWRAANSKPGGGLGLGLFIRAQIAKARGGQMAVSSMDEAIPGHGAIADPIAGFANG